MMSRTPGFLVIEMLPTLADLIWGELPARAVKATGPSEES